MFETLNGGSNSDRYYYTLPSYRFNRIFDLKNFDGTFDFSSDGNNSLNQDGIIKQLVDTSLSKKMNAGYYSNILQFDAIDANNKERELKFLHPLLKRQQEKSHIPRHDEFLTELIETKDGFHLFMYPFEGRLVHEIMASLIAYRLSKIKPLTFTIAQNDYGFELLSDQEIPLNEENIAQILSKENLMKDIIASINASEMASRKFRDIAVVAGLVIHSQPGNKKSNKSLQSSSGLIFRVLNDYEPTNLLLKQAYDEVFNYQLEKVRLQKAFERITESKIILKRAKDFTPLSFPLKVDGLRGTMTNEELSKRIQRIQKQAIK